MAAFGAQLPVLQAPRSGEGCPLTTIAGATAQQFYALPRAFPIAHVNEAAYMSRLHQMVQHPSSLRWVEARTLASDRIGENVSDDELAAKADRIAFDTSEF